MRAVRILWVDLCVLPARHGPCRLVPAQHSVGRIDRTHCPIEAVNRFRPAFACVEFDYPDRSRLRVVEVLRRAFPKLPVFVLTEYHSEALAIWAFRIGVWDYRVKPLDATTLTRSIEVLADLTEAAATFAAARQLPPDLIEPAGHLRQAPMTAGRTAPAIGHIANHFDQELTRHALADLCHLSESEFSRAFRREQGTTFECFVLSHRITQARELLAEGHTAIGQVAYAVGFRDPAYFSRAFRKLVGMTASEYREQASAVGLRTDGPCPAQRTYVQQPRTIVRKGSQQPVLDSPHSFANAADSEQ